ncbi:hypothetical protein FD754_021793, partial [Muntiacus muntjak]
GVICISAVTDISSGNLDPAFLLLFLDLRIDFSRGRSGGLGFHICPCYSLELCIQTVYLSFSPLPLTSLLFSAICRDLICIQSMDGMLMVFEQESYAFGRFLPGSLLPGPLAYSSRTDSFITVSSCHQVESYKYQVLAFATDADKRQETEQQKHGSGKRLIVDWTLNIGEQALDICIVSFNQSASSVFVLGERNFFCLKDNGQIRFMKKLDYSPSCFLPYCSGQATDAEVGADLVPSVTVKVTLRNRVALQKIKLSIYVQPPLVLTDDQFTFESLERNPDGIPRISQCKFRLPLKLVCLPGQPSKTASHKLTIDTNKPPVSLLSLFPGFAKQLEDDQVNVMGFHFLGGSQVTLLASKTSQRYRIQSEQFEDLWLITNELIVRLQEYFEKQGIKDFTCSFSGPVPLQEYFELIDHHFELRINGEKLEELLSERAVQFRAIQRRLLTRFKDKTPAPLQHLDTLLDGTYKQVHPCCCITLFHSFLWLSSIPLYICIISLF